MSYNIFLGGVGRMDAITTVVRETAPDLLGIQEADDEAAIARAIRRVRPGHHKNRIVCGTFDGPFGEHYKPS